MELNRDLIGLFIEHPGTKHRILRIFRDHISMPALALGALSTMSCKHELRSVF